MNAITTDLEDLLAAAHSARGKDLSAFLRLFADLYQGEYARLPHPQKHLCDQILLDLLPKMSLDQRLALAETIASNPAISHDVILHLAQDHMAVALPILEFSSVLTEQDLLGLISTSQADEHQAIASRCDLTPDITTALVTVGDDDTLKTIVNNHAAPLSELGLENILAVAKKDVTLRLPLLQRPDLPKEAALRIATWSSESIRSFVVTKLDRTPEPEAQLPTPAPAGARSVPTECTTVSPQPEKHRLAQLIAEGRLKPPFLIRALHRRDKETFFHAFAILMNIADADAERLLDTTSPTPMALACRAIGVSQPQFDTLFILLRRLKGAPPQIAEHDRQQIAQIFSQISPEKALSAIHAMV